MATRSALIEYGRALFFGQFSPTPPATFSVPAGPPVSAVSSSRAQGWQNEAWKYWKHVGELHYPTTRLARQTSQLEWRVFVNGRQLVPDSAKREMDLVTAGIGVDEATYLLSLNLQVAGEAWYVETDEVTPEGGGRFEVWSVAEPDLDKKLSRIRGIKKRIWQADPTDPNKADSSVRTALGPSEELLVLESLSRAQARSRLSQAGVVVTPGEQLYAAEDPWEQNLVDAMSSAIKDERHPSAFAPIHVRMRKDLIESIRYITFPRPYDDLIDRKIERAVRRIAGALDIEPELILGLGDSTYWNAWAVSMDTYQAHIAPRADQIGRLYAEIDEELRARFAGTEDSPTVEVEPDPRVMLARRSTVRDALDALAKGAVGFRYVRDAIGATDEDAPTEEELDIIAALQGRSVDRERRVGENPGPARSEPGGQASSDYDVAAHLSALVVAAHARIAVGHKLRDAWRHTPHRNRLSGIAPSDYATVIPLEDIAREMPLLEVITDAVREVAAGDEVARLTSWVIETLAQPMSALRARELV
jgi:hypothetical protein